MRALFVAGLLLSLCGCSTYTESQCANFDWNQKGYATAMSGYSEEQGLKHFYQECGEKYAINPSRTQFSAGFKDGLKVFCTPERGLKFGMSGKDYVGTCTNSSNETAFLKNYSVGINSYLKNRVGELESRVKNLEGDNEHLKRDNDDLREEVSGLKRKNSELDGEVSGLKREH
jgi:hypothetical protein